MLWLSLGTGLLSSFILFSYVKGTEHMMKHYRWIFVCLGLLPISLVYSAVLYLRNLLVFKLKSAPQRHQWRVDGVSQQIKDWIKSGSQKKLCTARPGWQTTSLRVGLYKKTHRNININMVDILDVDTDGRIVRCEPLVTMGQITALLSPMGWSLPVLPELDDLTVGGMVMGVGIESSSHKHGLFQHICEAFEVVLGNGDVVKCSKEENADLFHSIPWSYGTLCFLVSVDIRIVPIQSYVRLEYRPTKTRQQTVQVFKEQTCKEDGNDFVEGLMFGENEAVVMTGTLTEDVEADKINKIGNFYKPWFYKHVEGIMKTGYCVEYIPLRDYYHRHSRSIFWEMQDIIPFGNHPIFRYLFGWLLPIKISLLKLTQTKTLRELYKKRHIVQDMLVPLDDFEDALKCFHQEIKMYPLWICPFKLPANPGMVHPHSNQEELYVDIGAYGNPGTADFHYSDTVRRIEKFVRDRHGFQMLYADCFMTREEFRVMFDHSLYDKVRKDLQCEDAFPEVYDKICQSARY
ncbi:delta(24)-sterol reductase-like [Apostichopus japonicus]|uniref:delta(24)-sterol reductase-like n=1 Tax=Stichopus japonicus TaxID=307972 RepID=UPI003AB57CBA